MKDIEKPGSHEECQATMLPIKDTLEVLHGKWKLPILVALITKTMRFKEISREVNGITDKVLSKELKDLEINELIKREVIDTFPPTVKYSITPHGESLKDVIIAMKTWGDKHRTKIMR